MKYQIVPEIHNVDKAGLMTIRLRSLTNWELGTEIWSAIDQITHNSQEVCHMRKLLLCHDIAVVCDKYPSRFSIWDRVFPSDILSQSGGVRMRFSKTCCSKFPRSRTTNRRDHQYERFQWSGMIELLV